MSGWSWDELDALVAAEGGLGEASRLGGPQPGSGASGARGGFDPLTETQSFNPADNLTQLFALSEEFFSNIMRDPANIKGKGWQRDNTWHDTHMENFEPLLASIENPELQEYMRGIADRFATGLSLPALAMEPGFSELGVIGRELLPIMAMIPRLPMGLQKLVGRHLPPELLDNLGAPLRMFHMGNLPPGVGRDVPLAITNSERHGHWGFFGTPMLDNTMEYDKLRGSGQSHLYEFLFAPENPLRSLRFPGNAVEPHTMFRITDKQISTFESTMESLRPIARQVDDRLSVSHGVRIWEDKLDEALGSFKSELGTRAQGPDIGDYYRRANHWAKDMVAGHPDIANSNAFASILTDYMDVPGQQAFYGFGSNPSVPRTPDFSFTDLALRSGYDGGMGPWTLPRKVDFQTNPNVAAVPSEVASYLPAANVIYPVDSPRLVEFLRSRGVGDDEIRAAMRTSSPEGSGLYTMLGNTRYDNRALIADIESVLQHEGKLDLMNKPLDLAEEILWDPMWARALETPGADRNYKAYADNPPIGGLPGSDPENFVKSILRLISNIGGTK